MSPFSSGPKNKRELSIRFLLFFWLDYLLIFKTEATCYSKTSSDFYGLHGVNSRIYNSSKLLNFQFVDYKNLNDIK
jgi:hypothetical protein